MTFCSSRLMPSTKAWYSVPSPLNPGSAAYTFGAWIYIKSGASATEGFIGFGSGPSGLFYMNGGTSLRMNWNGSEHDVTPPTLGTAEWHFAAVTGAGGTSNVLLYSGSRTSAVTLRETKSLTPPSITAAWQIGAEDAFGTDWKQQIAHMFVANAQWSRDQLEDFARNPRGGYPNLVRYYPLHGLATNEQDFSGNAQHSTLSGTGSPAQDPLGPPTFHL